MKFKLTPQLTILLLIILLTGCNNPSKLKMKSDSDKVILDTLYHADFENMGNPINYDSVKVLKNLFVIKRNGVHAKDTPEQTSQAFKYFEYGTALDVIEITPDWIGVRARVTRKSIHMGRRNEIIRWEKVFIPKEATGNINDMKLLQEDLNIISSLTINNKTTSYEEGKILNDYLEIKLISSAIFNSKKPFEIEYLRVDTSPIRKKNGIIKLPIKSGYKLFTDKFQEETENQEFSYLGEIDFLNAYVISGVYWESWDYKFINKTTGKEEQSFMDYPNISPDKKHILCLSGNPYSSTGDIELYDIANNKIKTYINASFKLWMPAINDNTMFWSSDGYFYATVISTSTWGIVNENLKIDRQYIRIKILSKQK